MHSDLHLFLRRLAVASVMSFIKAEQCDFKHFKNVSTGNPTLSPSDIISDHKANIPVECFFYCVKEENCFGYNYRAYESGVHSANCQLSNSTEKWNKTEKGDWIYYQNVKVIEDINECSVERHACDENAECINTAGSYECQCRSGYVGDGKNCTDINECSVERHACDENAECINTAGSYECQCRSGYYGNGKNCTDLPTCTSLKTNFPSTSSGKHYINPLGLETSPLLEVYCDMTSQNGVGVTVIRHDSESKTLVSGYNGAGSYKKSITYKISMGQIVAIINLSRNCKQFIKYDCYHSRLFDGPYGWWVSRQGSKMNYWGGAAVNSGKCACGMTNTCGTDGKKCYCDMNDNEWREDSGYLTDKNTLPVTELRFGDADGNVESGYHTLGTLQCWD